MKILLLIICSFLFFFAQAQKTNLGSSTTMQVGSNATFYFGGSAAFNGVYNNEGTTVIESDATINTTINNLGRMQFRGDVTLEAAASLNNENDAQSAILGNATLDGIITNNGGFSVAGDETTLVSGSIVNNSELKFETNLDLTGTIDNTGSMNVTGHTTIPGTLLNPDGAVTILEGDLGLSAELINGGIFSVVGDAVVSSVFTNNNEAVFSGTVHFGEAINNEQKLFLGGNTLFNNILTNNGEIIGIADATLDFVSNENLGTLSFSDADGADPISEIILSSIADTINIDNLSMNTVGKITLPGNFVLIKNSLSIEQGVLNASNQENFLVQGTIVANGNDRATPSYVEGKMLAVTSDNATTFPMGINGFPNYVTINSDTPGVTVKVECKLPNPDSLFTDENTMGLAQDVEWVIQSLADSAEVTVSVDYSGVDFTSTPNFINAREYDATLQRFGQNDTVYQALRTIASANGNSTTTLPTAGTISTSSKIWISTKPTKFALGISPVLTEPEVYLPNVFSPGASLMDNQVFRPFIGGALVSEVSFLIYDSFNKEVYAETIAGDDLDLETIGWDGTLKSGQQAPEGVYYYRVNLSYLISDDVSDKYFTSGERGQTQDFSKLGTVLLVK